MQELPYGITLSKFYNKGVIMKVHYIKAANDGCGLVQCDIPAKYINKIKGHTATVSRQPESIDRDLIEKSDILIMQRQFKNSVFQEAKKQKGKRLLIYDLDDDFWSLKEDKNNPATQQWNPHKTYALNVFVDLCDAVTCHTPIVAKQVQKIFPEKPIYIMPPMVDLEEAKKIKFVKKRDSIRIGFVGSPTHAYIMENVGHAMLNVARKHREVVLVFFGLLPQAVIGRLPFWRQEFYNWVTPSKFYNMMGTLGLDIGLCPNLGNDFGNTRSIRKVLDYGMFGTPSIATDWGAFRDLDKDMVVKVNPKNKVKQWENAIEHLIVNEKERKERAKKTSEFVKQLIGVVQAPEWIRIYKEALNNG